MVGKKTGKALLKEEGLERTDNRLEITSWPQVPTINQKNYYTDYLKRDDQMLVLRAQNEENRNRLMKAAKDKDRAMAQANRADVPPEEGAVEEDDEASGEEAEDQVDDFSGSKVIVIHPGSQNLRIGLASDALPKSIPMVIARRWPRCECEENGDEPRPRRPKTDDEAWGEPEELFGKEFAQQFTSMSAALKTRMRNNKRRVLPNSKDTVMNYNKRTPPEIISEHNDSSRAEWTELPPEPSAAPDYFIGNDAIRIPDFSTPRYRLFWPLQHGWYNERDYSTTQRVDDDIATILEDAIKNQLGLRSKREWSNYSCVFIVPDLYERRYVISAIELILREFGFSRLALMQESLAATFGAGYTSACVVDIGAQKTSICCVEEGMCVENSRVNLKYGGADVTETFVKMMLYDFFPYREINLNRRYDWLLAEELKRKFCTMNEANIGVQTYEFYLRAPAQETRRYGFKTFDEVMLAPMGLFNPSILDLRDKLQGRRKLIDRSYDLYDGCPNDPLSTAQISVYEALGYEPTKETASTSVEVNGEKNVNGSNPAPASSRQQPEKMVNGNSEHAGGSSPPSSPSPGRSPGRSPVPESTDTPQPTAAPANQISAAAPPHDPNADKIVQAEERDQILPAIPLDQAILTSITNGSQADEKKTRDFLGGIMVVGGGGQIPGFHTFLEERLKESRPGFAKDIMIGTPPRELDPQVVVWKGGSVFAKLRVANECWINQLEYDRLSTRVLLYRCLWLW